VFDAAIVRFATRRRRGDQHVIAAATAIDVSAETLNPNLTMDPMHAPHDGVRRLIARFGAANHAACNTARRTAAGNSTL
jgi:hypothetical protein